MSLLAVLPVLVPLSAAVVSLATLGSRTAQRATALAGTGGLLAAALALLARVRDAGIETARIGGWPAPFGITLVADLFAAILLVLAGFIGFATAVYSIATIDRRREASGYYALLHAVLLGVCGSFLTGDLFNLFVWFEVMLIASFVLLVLGGEPAELAGGIKYVVLNLVASALLLAAAGLAYGATGTLGLADLAGRLAALGSPATGHAIAMLLVAAFAIKAAVFPFFFWLPASYHTPPAAVAALFSALLTKVGVYALVRTSTLLFPGEVPTPLLLVLAGLTMVTGVLGAVAQLDMRRLLAFHIISQIGYLLMGLALASPLALAGTIFFLAHIMLAKPALFLVSGLVERVRGTSELERLGGLARGAPVLATLFLVPALSMAGLPPFPGFFAKLALVRAGLADGRYAIVAAALGVSVLTLYSMLKIWDLAFWKPAPAAPSTGGAAPPTAVIATGGVVALTLALGLAAGPAMDLAVRAAEQLLDRSAYVHAVLGSTP